MSEEIISEIEEDLQKERFKKYWKNYGKYISLLIMFIIFSVGGWQIYELLEKRRNIDASNIFLNILDVSKEDTVSSFKGILEGKYDDIPEQAFAWAGGISDVIAKAKEMQEAK